MAALEQIDKAFDPSLLSDPDLERAYLEEIEHQAEQLRHDSRVVDELLEILQQPEAPRPGSNRPLFCDTAALLGSVGRGQAAEITNRILALLPTTELSNDQCVVGALVSLGPGAFEALANHAKSNRDEYQAYYATVALLAPTKDTEFLKTTDMWRDGKWTGEPLRTRASRQRIVEKWERWWAANNSRFAWNVMTNRLEPIARERE